MSLIDFCLFVIFSILTIEASIITSSIVNISRELKKLNINIIESNRILSLIQSSSWRKL